MSQPLWNFTSFGTGNTSSGGVNIKAGPAVLSAIVINASSTGTDTAITFYDATSSSTGKEIIVLRNISVGDLVYGNQGIQLVNGLTRGGTSSTVEMTVVWG